MAKKISIVGELDSSAVDYISEVVIEILTDKEIEFTAFDFSIEVNYEGGEE
jgi:hypothetical protein